MYALVMRAAPGCEHLKVNQIKDSVTFKMMTCRTIVSVRTYSVMARIGERIALSTMLPMLWWVDR